MSGYIIFEHSRLYHALDEGGTTACGIPEDVYRYWGEELGGLGRARVFGIPPATYLPCVRCERAGGVAREEAAAGGEPPDVIEAGDWVQVVAGPQAGRIGRVAGVTGAKGEAETDAVFKVKFSDGSESGHVGETLKKVNS